MPEHGQRAHIRGKQHSSCSMSLNCYSSEEVQKRKKKMVRKIESLGCVFFFDDLPKTVERNIFVNVDIQ